jgi:hypothetical protein
MSYISIIGSLVIYGWEEENRKNMIDISWIENNNIYVYPAGIFNNKPDGLIYGLPCHVDYRNGNIVIDEQHKRLVTEAFKKTEKYYEKNSKFCDPVLGYYKAIYIKGYGVDYNYENYIPELTDEK